MIGHRCFFCLLIYSILCIGALLVVPLNAIGFFGMTPDPLSALFLVLLSTPWNFILDGLMEGCEGSVIWNLILAFTGMLINGGIVALVCTGLRRLKH